MTKIDRIIFREKVKAQDLLNLLQLSRCPSPYCIPATVFKLLPRFNHFSLNHFEYTWLLFTSPRAVQLFKNLCKEIPNHVLIASIGQATTRAINVHFSRVVNFQSPVENASEMGKSFSAYLDIEAKSLNKRISIFHPCSALAKDTLKCILKAHGYFYEPFPFYKPVPNPALSASLNKIISVPLQWVLFYSPSAIDAFLHSGFEPASVNYVISIGPVTSSRLAELGFNRIVESKDPHPKSLLKAIVATESKINNN